MIRRPLPFLLLALSFALAAPLGASAVTVERIAVIVDDQVITLSEVEERAAQLRARSPNTPSRLLQHEAVEDLISEKLLEKELKTLSIDVSPTDLQLAIDDLVRQNGLPDQAALRRALERQGMSWTEYRETLRSQLAQMKLINLKVRSQVKVSEEEVKRRYAEVVAANAGEQEVHASHILVMLAPDAPSEAVEEALSHAKDLAEKARSGGDFAALAAEASEGPIKGSGGDLGWFRRGEMVRELEQAAFALEPGQVSDPVRTRFGWHVIKLDDKRDLPPRPLDELASSLREGLYREELERQTEQYIVSLKKNALLEYPMAEFAPSAKPGK